MSLSVISTDAFAPRDPYADYASNLTGFAARIVDDPAYLASLEGEGGGETNVAAVIANAAMGAFVIPTLWRKLQRGAPVGGGAVLAGALIGGLLAWWQPVPTTLVQSTALLFEL
jgi:hypothetical protein